MTQGRKMLIIPRARRGRKVSFTSVESIEVHILTDTGILPLCMKLLLTNAFLDEADQVEVPLPSTSRS
jgi:hypothetical protein